MQLPELTLAFNKKFNLDKSASAINSVIANHKFNSGRRGNEINKNKSKLFTESQVAWLKVNYQKLDRNILHSQFNHTFNSQLTLKQIVTFLRNNKIKSGRTGAFKKGNPSWNKGVSYQPQGHSEITRFKKGMVPHNLREIGAERLNVDGYTEIKTDTHSWKSKHRVIWQQHYGKNLTADDIIIFKDGNSRNFDINNLEKVNRKEHFAFNQSRINQQPPELKESFRLICKINIKTRA